MRVAVGCLHDVGRHSNGRRSYDPTQTPMGPVSRLIATFT